MPEQPIILSVITQVLASTNDNDLMSLLKTVNGVTSDIINKHQVVCIHNWVFIESEATTRCADCGVEKNRSYHDAESWQRYQEAKEKIVMHSDVFGLPLNEDSTEQNMEFSRSE